MEYVSPPVLKNKMEHALSVIYEAFGFEPPGYVVKLMGDTLLSEQTIDFGRLDEELQAGIIRTLVSNEVVYRDVSALNPFLAGLADWQSDEHLIAENNGIIRRAYGKERIAAILRETYRGVMNTRVVHKLSKMLLLEKYLDPLRLSLVGVGHV
jgi:hypothetical protein